MEKKNSQYKMVLNHLREHGSITSIDAIYLYGCTRLSSLIYNMRNEGYNIITETMNGINRYGNPTQYAKYILKDDKNRLTR